MPLFFNEYSLNSVLRFESFLRGAELQKQCKGLNIRAFLILPIQRVPRYELLLKEIIKQTKHPSVEDVDRLRGALDLIHRIADHINSSITHQEKRNKVLELQIAFGVTLADPARKFIREGPLSKTCRNGKKSKSHTDI